MNVYYIYWLVLEQRFRDYPFFDIGPSWFLLVMFFVYVIVYELKDFTKNKKKFLVIVMINIVSIIFLKTVFNNIDKTIFVWFLRTLTGTLWYFFGIIGKVIFETLELKLKLYQYIFLSVFLLIVNIISAIINGHVSIFSAVFNNYLIYFISGISGIYAIFILCKNIIKNNKLLEYLGNYTIVIMTTHEPIKRVIIGMLQKVGLSYEFFKNSYIGAILLLPIIIVIEILIISILKLIKNKFDKNYIIKYILYFVK